MTDGIYGRVLDNTNQFIVVNKRSGESVQPDHTGPDSLLAKVRRYCKHPVHVVNRLDKPVSGVVLFAKKASSMHDLSMLGSVGGMRKIYLAIVDKIPSTVGLIENHFTHNRKLNKSFAGSEKTADSKKGRTDLEVIASSDRYHLIKVEILSGRHHQIRAQMEALESHIKGDVKYGARRGNKDRSICLHSWKIIFKHPGDNSTVSIAAPLPEDALWKVFAAPIEALNNRINEESESGD